MTGHYKGFDAVDRMTDGRLVDLYRKGYRVAGFYLGGPEATVSQLTDPRYKGYAADLVRHGFTLAPIFVGYQQGRLADMTGTAIRRDAKAHAVQAESMLAHLVSQVPHGSHLPVILDWETGMTADGLLYIGAFRPGVLYRPTSGEKTPYPEWSADPDLTEAQAIEELGKRQVMGVQYRDDYQETDLSVWDKVYIDSFRTPAHAPKPPKAPSQAVVEATQAATVIRRRARVQTDHLRHPTSRLARLTTSLVAGQGFLLALTHSHPTLGKGMIALGASLGWSAIQEVLTKLGATPATITEAHDLYREEVKPHGGS